MGIIPKKICPNCGEEYSALSPRCPKCGERNVKQSSRAANTTASAVQGTPSGVRAAKNAQYQLIFGGVIILLVIVAVIILISVSLSGGGSGSSSSGKKDKHPAPTETPVAETMEIATPEPTPIPTPVITPSVNSITINFGQNKVVDVTLQKGEVLTFTAAVYPTDIDAAANCKWSVGDTSIATIETNGINCTVTPLETGTTKLYLECFGGSADCFIRVR